jgi:Antitoxin-like ribbon-helix-helix
MAKNKLTALLNEQQTASRPPSTPVAKKAAKPPATRTVHKPGDVNISAYFNPEVKAALRHVQAKSGKSIKGCLAEALQMLFRKHNVAVTVSDE